MLNFFKKWIKAAKEVAKPKSAYEGMVERLKEHGACPVCDSHHAM